MRGLVRLLSEKRSLLLLAGGWIVLYVTLAIWSEEAFGKFVFSLTRNPLYQVPYVIFILSSILNLYRASRGVLSKGRAYFVLWVVLPVGIIVFLSGFLLSISFRQQEIFLVGEGDSVRPRGQSISYMVSSIKPPLKEELLGIEGEAVFMYEPEALLSNGDESFRVGVFPPVKAHGYYYHIMDFGLAPGVRLVDIGRVLNESYVPLRLLPPGSIDYFEIAPFPYRFSLRLAPEQETQVGPRRFNRYNLKHPIYNLRIVEGDEIIYEGTTKGIIYFGSLWMEFLEPTYWARLEVVRDPAMKIVLLGFLLTGSGIIARALLLAIRATSK